MTRRAGGAPGGRRPIPCSTAVTGGNSTNDDQGDAGRVSFLDRGVSPSFERRVVVIPPGQARPYDESEWREAIVVVERGQVDLVTRNDGRRRFSPGAVLALEGLPLRALDNPTQESVVLVAVSRR